MPAPRLLRITTVPQSLAILLNGQLEFMAQNGYEVLAVSSEGPEVAILQSNGVRHKALTMTRSITPLRDLISLVQLIMLMRSFKPDIVHTHTPKAGLLGMIAAWLCGVPVRLHTVAGLPVVETKGLTRRLLFWTERITSRCATGVYTNSSGLRKFMIEEIGISAARLKTLGHGSSNGIDWRYFSRSDEVDQQAVSIRSKFNVPPGAHVICFIGRVVRDKGVVELVESFKSFARTDVRLMIVGPFEHDLDPLPAEVLSFLKSSDRVILAGFQRDIRPWLAASDVFVLPSYREGFPNVVMQAACMGVPCIVTDINGCNEIITNQVSGLTVPVRDVPALIQAINTMLSNEQLCSGYAMEARKKVIRDFDQAHIWKLILGEYTASLALTKPKRD